MNAFHSKRVIECLFLLFFILLHHVATASFDEPDTTQVDTLTRKENKALKRKEFRKEHENVFFQLGFVYASLNTEVSFELFNQLLTARIGLEDQLGLPGKQSFIIGSLVYRFTPTSGIYAQYYGINRTQSWTIDDELIFQQDTIHVGATTSTYFDTQVISAGYLLTLKQDPSAYLGAYLNIYFMWLGTGIRSTIGDIDSEVNLVAPLPNFGLVAMFRLTRWLSLNGTIGFFSLYTPQFKGTLYDFNVRLGFKPAQWLSFGISYQEFDVRVQFPEKDINTIIDYNFRGPALSTTFIF